MQPMADWHLYNVYKDGVAGGLINYIWMFGVIGILVLVIACINLQTSPPPAPKKEPGRSASEK